MARAKRGGEMGMNGEWYQGGEFLPNTKLKKGVKRTYSRMVFNRIDNESDLIWYDQAEKHAIFELRGKYATCFIGDIMRPTYRTNAAAQALIDRFNAGERWCTPDEMKAVWKRD